METTAQAPGTAPAPAGRFPAITWVLLLAFVLRLLHLASAARNPLTFQPGPDEDFYLRFGQAIADGWGLQSPEFAFMDPLYALLIAGVLALGGSGFGVFLVQVVVDLGTAWVLYRIGCEWQRPRAGLIAAGLYAFCGLAVLYTTTWLKETWVVFFVSTWLLFALRAFAGGSGWRWLLLGAWTGVLVALRGNWMLLALASLALPWLAPGAGEPEGGSRPRRALALVLGLVLPLALLAARNHGIAGGWSPLPNNGGIVLHQLYRPDNLRSVNAIPDFVAYLHPSEIWRGYRQEAERRHGGALSATEVDRYWRTQALDYIRSHPQQVAAAVAGKLAAFLAPPEVPNNRSLLDEQRHSTVLRWLPPAFPWLLALGLPGLLLLARSQARGWLPLLPLATALATVLLFFAESRFRFHALPLFALGTGVLLDQTWQRRAAPGGVLIVAWGSAAGLALLSFALASAQPPIQPSYDRDAWGYIRMGDFDAAAAVAMAMLARDAKDPLAHEALGFVATLRKQDETAIAHYSIAVGQRPRLHGAWFNLARLHAGRGESAAAELALAKALAITPLAEYRLWLASHLQGQGRPAEAQVQWRAVLAGSASPAERDQAVQALAASRR